MQAEAKDALEKYRAQLAEARTEAAQIRDQARAEGQQILEELRAQAQEESARIVARGEEQLATARQQVVNELRGQIGALAVDLAGRVVGESLADDARRRRHRRPVPRRARRHGRAAASAGAPADGGLQPRGARPGARAPGRAGAGCAGPGPARPRRRAVRRRPAARRAALAAPGAVRRRRASPTTAGGPGAPAVRRAAVRRGARPRRDAWPASAGRARSTWSTAIDDAGHRGVAGRRGRPRRARRRRGRAVPLRPDRRRRPASSRASSATAPPPAEGKAALLDRLLAGRVSPVTEQLLRNVLTGPHVGNAETAVERLSEVGQPPPRPVRRPRHHRGRAHPRPGAAADRGARPALRPDRSGCR